MAIHVKQFIEDFFATTGKSVFVSRGDSETRRKRKNYSAPPRELTFGNAASNGQAESANTLRPGVDGDYKWEFDIPAPLKHSHREFAMSARLALPKFFIALPLAAIAATFTFVSAARADDQAAPRIRVMIWDEQQPEQKEVYDNFLGNEIAGHLKKMPGVSVRSVALSDPDQGLSPELLDNCDVLIWWGHKKHTEVPWEKARDIARRIKEGKLSLFALHSAHWSRPFIEAMCERAREDAIKSLPPEQRATAKLKEIPPVLNALPEWDAQLTPNVTCVKKWDEPVEVTLKMPSCVFPYVTANGKPSHVFTLLPDHPIAQGVPHEFVLEQTETYAEPWHVPQPDAVIFEEHWQPGYWFRSGSLWQVGKGKVFYFRPGHEIYPIFKNPVVLRIIDNAVRYLGQKS